MTAPPTRTRPSAIAGDAHAGRDRGLLASAGSLLGSRFFWFLLLTFIAGLGLLHPPAVEPLPGGTTVNRLADTILGHELRHKLGDAFIIAALLSILLDRYLKHELLREATKDVLSFAAGHDVPPKLKDVIAAILRQPYMRQAFELTLALEPLGKTAFVRLVLKTRYSVRNLTGDRQHYPFQSAIEKSYVAYESSRIRRVKVSDEAGTAIDLCDFDLIPQTPGEDGYVRFAKDVVLPPSGELSVETERSTVYPDSYFYVLDILQFTEGVTVRVSSGDDYAWNVVFGAAGNAQRQGPVWTHPGAHLPGQYVRITWNRKHRGAG